MPVKSDRRYLEGSWAQEWLLAYRAAVASDDNFGFQPFDASHPNFRNDYIARCPCCQTKVQTIEQQSLLHIQRNLWIAAVVRRQMYKYSDLPITSLGDAGQQFMLYSIRDTNQRSPSDFRLSPQRWACDACISSGRAEYADFEIAYRMGSPFVYFDYLLQCFTCEEEFVYTRGEQRWAYEVFVINQYSHITTCKTCRHAKRDRKRLDNLIYLARTDANPFKYLKTAAALMQQFDDPRTREYLCRAKNKAPTLEERQQLEVEIAMLKAKSQDSLTF